VIAQWTLFSYFAAVVAATVVLAIFRASSWYLHVTGAALGLVAGLMPPVGASGDAFYLIAGTIFLFFTVWGFGGLLLRRPKRGSRGRVVSDGMPHATRLAKSANLLQFK
jgi:hypothetical protein